MYQFYYAQNVKEKGGVEYKSNVRDILDVAEILPTMWEEHCLECSAPTCYKECKIYRPRIDGRCRRFESGLFVQENKLGVCGQSARVKFLPWANMMTVVFNSLLPYEEYFNITQKNQKLGIHLKKINESNLPRSLRWQYTRGREYIRRRKLRNLVNKGWNANYFVFHGYNFESYDFNLVIELYDDHTPISKTSIRLLQGENLIVLGEEEWFSKDIKPNYILKVYPENNLEAEIEILWCDFVKAHKKQQAKYADKVKCLVWDLDNTLWEGVLIESDNPDALKIREGVMQTIKQLDARGIIQSIASKNNYEEAWERIKALGISEYFLYPQISWGAKSQAIKNIAKSLNIGIDSMALIDDSVFEREQVKSECPQVRVYDETEATSLCNKEEFSIVVTEESKNRRKMYAEEEKRSILMNENNDSVVSFIEKSRLSINIFEPTTETEILRCFELVVRTNQLNMSGKKYTREEFENVLKRENVINYTFSAKDKFGSYGIVGYGQYVVNKNEIEFCEFAMSCRVASKFVESALFYELLNRNNCNRGRFNIIKTKKNVLLVNTLKNIGFKTEKEDEKTIAFVFDSNLKEKNLVKIDKKETTK